MLRSLHALGPFASARGTTVALSSAAAVVMALRFVATFVSKRQSSLLGPEMAVLWATAVSLLPSSERGEPAGDATSPWTMQGGPVKAFRGAVVHSIKLGQLEVIRDALLTVAAGGEILRVVDLERLTEEERHRCLVEVALVLEDLGDRMLVPGLVDGHAHAPQYSFVGTGMDLPLLQWLETYTFPSEAKFKDEAHARNVYEKAVRRHILCGTTSCSWFGTLHLDASKVLVDVVRAHGQRVHVGKVSMDRNAPDYYRESTKQGLADVERFIRYVETTRPLGTSAAQDRVTASIIPRFVPSCTSELMSGLGRISNDLQLPVHSHLSESPAEIAWVKELHPQSGYYAQVYEEHGLLHERSYMAHCCHCCMGERSVLKAAKAGVVHCPSSNFMLKSGVLNVRQMLNEGVKVGLGTDIAGGYASSILDALRQAIIASRVSSFYHESDSKSSDPAHGEPLTYAEAFHLATLGGAEVLGLADKVGNFVPGKQFDALLVELSPPGAPFDLLGDESVLEKFEKFLFLGDDRNISKVFVQGEVIMKRDPTSGSVEWPTVAP